MVCRDIRAIRFVLIALLFISHIITGQRKEGVEYRRLKCPERNPYWKSPYRWIECGEYYIMKKPPTRAALLRALYPGYFLNATEAQALREHAECRSKRLRGVKPNVRPRRDVSPIADKILSDSILHGCCESVAMYSFPTSAPNLNGTEVKIVQEEGTKQALYTESCVQDATCDLTCNCTQVVDLLYEVIIYDEDDDTGVSVDWVAIPGSCKCVNI